MVGIRRILAAWVLSAAPAWALTSIVTGPIKNQITHAGVRLLWVADASSFTRWGWDTVSHSGATSSTSYAKHFTSNSKHTIHGMYINGLLAGTTYFYRACAFDGAATEVCAAEDSFTTLALPNPHPAPPNPPAQVDVTIPSCANGRLHCLSGVPVTHTVGSNCDDPSTGLVATYNGASWGDTILIPVTTTCGGSYSLSKAAWDGVSRMVVESASAASLLPGVRVSPSQAPLMPVFEENVYAHPGFENQAGCYPGGFYWDGTSSTPGFFMNYCGQVAAATISNVTGSSGGINYAITLSLPVASVSVGQWGYMTGVGGLPKANGSFQVTSVTSNSQFTVTVVNGYVSPGGASYTGGGSLALFDWQAVSFTSYSGVAPTGSCSPGTTAASAWAYSNAQPSGAALLANLPSGEIVGTRYSTERVWRCTAVNTWTPHYVQSPFFKESQAPNAAVLNISNTSHTWFIGLNFGHAPVPNDPLLYHVGLNLNAGAAGETQGGSSPEEYIVGQSQATSDVIFDRCIATRQWPAKGAQLIQLDGNNIALMNSYVQADGAWWGHEERGSSFDNSAGDLVSKITGGPTLVDNNYLEGYGITVHFNEQAAGTGLTGSIHDVTVTRNTFFRNLTKIDQAPGSVVDYYTPLRQLLEFKSGINVNVTGNTFQNNFRNVSQGGAMALTPTELITQDIGMECFPLVYSGSNATCTIVSILSFQVNVGDWMFISGDPAHIFQVTAASGNQVTMANVTPGLGSVQFVQVLTGGDGVSDVNIASNTFTNLPTILANYSHLSHDQGPFRVSQDRVRFANNILNGIGPGGNGSGILSVPISEEWQTSGATGSLSNIWGGITDWVFDHNTIYQYQQQPTLLGGSLFLFVNNDFPLINVLENEGLQITNNLYWTSNSVDQISTGATSGIGTCAGRGFTVLNCFMTGNVPFNFDHNATVLAGGYPGSYDNINNFWSGVSTAPQAFASAATGNFALLYNSAFNSGGAQRANDGQAQGAAVNTLLAAQGTVTSARALRVTATGALVSFFTYSAADSGGCMVDYGTDPVFGSFTRVAGAGTLGNHSAALSGLTPLTQYFFRVECQAQQPAGTFMTR